MEYFIAAAVIGGFAYFVYTRTRKSRKAPSGGSGGGGGGSRDPNVREEVQ